MSKKAWADVLEKVMNQATIKRAVRTGWAAAARRMRERGDDQLLDPATSTRFDKEEWEWR